MRARRAVILAGGRGTRLRPYTVVLPKPLMPIGDYPILEVIVRQLARAGFSRITLAVNHQEVLRQISDQLKGAHRAERLVLARIVDADIPLGAVLEESLYQLRLVIDGERDAREARASKLPDDHLEDRIVADWHKRLGQHDRIRAQTRTLPAGENDRSLVHCRRSLAQEPQQPAREIPPRLRTAGRPLILGLPTGSADHRSPDRRPAPNMEVRKSFPESARIHSDWPDGKSLD